MNNNNYGFVFNNLEVKDNILTKSAKNEYGRKKINNEILFYENILKTNIPFSIPDIYLLDASNSTIKMEFLNDYNTLTRVFYNSENPVKQDIIENIRECMNRLHSFTHIQVSKELFVENVFIETREKVVERFETTDWKNIETFKKIKKINGLSFHDIYYYLNIINSRISDIICKTDYKYQFVLIHGDLHFGNIMTNSDNSLCFIDPRGFFGKNKLYGIKEYDYAKLLFGISGYSVFDEMIINDIVIDEEGNCDIGFINDYCDIYEKDIFDDFTKLISLTIWLSNNSTFIDVNKKITSLVISYYLCEKYLER
jgi:5-methylthioribose kinase